MLLEWGLIRYQGMRDDDEVQRDGMLALESMFLGFRVLCRGLGVCRSLILV